MSEINFNSIYDGVSLALHAAFPNSAVRGGDTAQGVNPGDFNVVMPSANQTKEVGNRYRRTPLIDVIYYPTEGVSDCYDKAHHVVQVLWNITTPEGDIIHARSCSWEVTDGVLHVFFQYDHFVHVPQDKEYMETLKIELEE